MKLFGLTITRTKAVNTGALTSIDGDRDRGWFRVLESYTGAWQQNVEIRLESVLTHPTVFACITLIASDVAKISLNLAQRTEDGIWIPVDRSAFSPLLNQPNNYQDQKQFLQSWMFSKLIWGNTYVLKSYDNRNVVNALYILDPARVRPLLAPDGALYYELKQDNLSRVEEPQLIVPASQIIHDRMYCIYHPLVGLSPLHASGLAAVLGLKIQTNSANFFSNGSNPGGVLTAPGSIAQETADRLKAYWDAQYTGANVGKVAVLGDGLKYEQMHVNADNAQLTEQWEATSKAIASTFHVPWHLVGGPPPPYNNIQALTVQYFTQCLQKFTVQLESCLDTGLQLPKPLGTMFNVKDLLWMDSQTMMQVIKEGIGSGVMTPNEGRLELNLPPVVGGDTPYLQQQNYSLEALNKRDSKADPFETQSNAPKQITDGDQPVTDEDAKHAAVRLKYYLTERRAA